MLNAEVIGRLVHLWCDSNFTLEHIARMYVDGTLLKEIDKIPIIMRPKGTDHISSLAFLLVCLLMI